MNIFFTADTHFNHAKVIQFESTTRNFSTIEEHDETLIKNWNDRVRPKYGFVMSHVPLHPDSVERWGLNVHGHLHSNSVKDVFKSYAGNSDGVTDITPLDKRYFCVSVEQHNLAPVSLDEIRNLTTTKE